MYNIIISDKSEVQKPTESNQLLKELHFHLLQYVSHSFFI